jgi:hypothetical protein
VVGVHRAIPIVDIMFRIHLKTLDKNG